MTVTQSRYDRETVVLGGVRTRCLRAPGRSPTVVLLHGFTDSADTWRPLLRELADRGLRAAAVDLPHFGAADRPISDTVLGGYDSFAAAAIDYFDSGDGVVLVGNSVGGLVALRASQDPRPGIRAVVAIGPAGLHTPQWLRTLSRATPLLALLSRAPVPSVTSFGPLLPAVWAALFSLAVARGRLTPATKDHYASHIHTGDVKRVLALGLRTITELIDPAVVDPARFAVPVTLIWGRHDWICPPTGAKTVLDIRRADVDVDVVIYPDAGHCTQLERPADIAVRITTLIADTAHGRTTALEG
ncbi:alpha/beta hydrolase [Nocardia uniformis]|uniref:Alpha/beta hydrolase n=1 Tax=Nocardia uniformis TaxID=53432 RepID=A0A849C3U9_9NOCA|nr:alpha/beta hydrolase [Nocardia uniformis]NNH71120.1 alpha/beta hydrolase [Nocardia uniformis]